MGWEHAFDAAERGFSEGATFAPREGNTLRGADRRVAEALPADGGRGDGRRDVPRPHDGLVPLAGAGAEPGGGAARRPDTLRSSRSGSTCACSLWKGAPIPAFRPSRGDVRDVEEEKADETHEDPGRRSTRAPARLALAPREDDRDRRPGRLRRRHRSHRGGRRPFRFQRPPCAGRDRLARRCGPDQRPRRGRRGRAFPDAVGEVAGEQLPAADRSRSGRRRRAADRPHGAREGVRRGAERRLPRSSSRMPARCGVPNGSSTSRTSSCGRPRLHASYARSSWIRRARTSGSLAPPAHPRRPGRHTRRARGADRRRRGRRPHPRLLPLRALGRARRSDLRAREDRNRRRSLAHARVGQPQRALALQRHRDERRRPTIPRSRGAHDDASGRSTSSAPRTDRQRPDRGDRRALEDDRHEQLERRNRGEP